VDPGTDPASAPQHQARAWDGRLAVGI